MNSMPVYVRYPSTLNKCTLLAYMCQSHGDGGKSNAGREEPGLLRFSVFVPQPFDKHLFFWFVVVHEQVANAASADKVANFFCQILGVVAGAFERLRHENNLQAGVVRDILRILDVTQEDDISQAV